MKTQGTEKMGTFLPLAYIRLTAQLQDKLWQLPER
jgi:hypothetical protein